MSSDIGTYPLLEADEVISGLAVTTIHAAVESC